MTLDQFFMVFLVIGTFTLMISMYPLIIGLWPVMLISLLHVVAVGWCFRSAWRNNWFCQFVCFEKDTVTVKHRSVSHSWQVTWPTTWLRIVSITDKHKENRVYLCHHNQKQEIGGFLPQDERKHLEKMMKRTLLERTAWSTQHRQETMST